MSSTGQFYHRAATRRGDDRSMTRCKLLNNDTQLFIFISILIMTQLHPRDPENGQQNRFSERASWEKNSYNRLNEKAWVGLMPVRIYREIMPSSVSVDLIGEKNQVILEFTFKPRERTPCTSMFKRQHFSTA